MNDGVDLERLQHKEFLYNRLIIVSESSLLRGGIGSLIAED